LQNHQQRVEKYKTVMYDMKIGYMKELNSLREMLRSKQSLGSKYEYLEVRYFTSTDGTDDKVLCKLL